MIFGAHESIAGGVSNAVERGMAATCDAIQMFNKSSNQWRAKPLSPDELDKYFEALDTTGVRVAASHSSYLINIASPDRTMCTKSLKSLQEEMERCGVLKIPNLVMHPGSHLGEGEAFGIKRIADNVNRLFDRLKHNTVTLFLETTAGQGAHLGFRFEQLAEIIDLVDDGDHVGVCLDTCHVFAAGYPLTDPSDYRKTMMEFDEVVGLSRLKIIHVNDSKKEFGSRRDRHEHIGQGCIGIEAFRNIVNDRRLARVPLILETPKGDDLAEDVENLKVLRSLVKKNSQAARKTKASARKR